MGKITLEEVPNITVCVIKLTWWPCEAQMVLVPFTVESWNFCGDMSFNKMQILLRWALKEVETCYVLVLSVFRLYGTNYSMIKECVAVQGIWNSGEEGKVLGGNLQKCYFVHHK
jgi:hypothetical protein